MSLEGRDVWEGNGDLTPDWFGQWAFVYIRAFNEHGRPDTRFHQYWEASRGRTKRGVYGWPIHGVDNTVLGRQLATLVTDADLVPMADYESGSRQLPSVAELEAYVRACNGGFYSNLSQYVRSPYLDSRPWWFANPSGNPAPRPPAVVQYGIVNGVDANRADTLTPILKGAAHMPLDDADKAYLENLLKTQGISGAADERFNGIDKAVAEIMAKLAEIEGKVESVSTGGGTNAASGTGTFDITYH